MLTYKEILKQNQELISKYEISPNSRQSEYLKILCAAKCTLFSCKHKNKHPMFLFASGPAGAGKTALVRKIMVDYKHLDFIILDIDSLRQFHPDISQIRKYPTLAAILTDSLALNLQTDLLKYAVKLGYNVIWSSSINSMKKVLELKAIVGERYTIGFYSIACNTIESRISAEERYEQELQDITTVPRFPDENFMRKCDKYLSTLQELEDSDELSFIKVFKRSPDKDGLPELLYDSNTRKKKNAYFWAASVSSYCNPTKCLKRLDILEKQRILRNASLEEKEKISIIKNLIENFY